MKDSYANYFCTKFYLALTHHDKLKFLSYIKPFGAAIATNKIGTYPLQAIIESLKTEDEKMIVVETFRKDILNLSFVSVSKSIFI